MSDDEATESVRRESLKEALRQVDHSILLTYARYKDPAIANDAAKEEIIDVLVGDYAGEMQDVLRNAVRLELKSTKYQILDAIERNTKEMRGESQSSIEKEIKSVDALKTLFGLTGGALALIVAAGGLFSVIRINDLNNVLIEANSKLDVVESKLRQTGALSLAYRKYLTNQLIEDLEAVMDEFSTRLYSSRFDGTLKRNAAALEDLLKIVSEIEKGGVNPSDDNTVARVLRRLYVDLAELTDLRDEELEPRELTRLVQAAKSKWEIPIPAIGAEEYGIFKKRADTYRHTLLGVIKYKQFRVGGARERQLLEQSVAHFDEAIGLWDDYAPAYSNKSAAIGELYRLAVDDRDSSSEQRIQLLKLGKRSLEMAASRNPPHGSLSLLYNNLASYNHKLARLHFDENDRASAEEALNYAFDAVTNAEGVSQVASVAYVTHAELHCTKLKWEESGTSRIDSGQEGKLFAEMKLLIGRASVNGYRVPSTVRTRRDFENYFDFRCRAVEENWQAIYDALKWSPKD